MPDKHTAVQVMTYYKYPVVLNRVISSLEPPISALSTSFHQFGPSSAASRKICKSAVARILYCGSRSYSKKAFAGQSKTHWYFKTLRNILRHTIKGIFLYAIFFEVRACIVAKACCRLLEDLHQDFRWDLLEGRLWRHCIVTQVQTLSRNQPNDHSHYTLGFTSPVVRRSKPSGSKYSMDRCRQRACNPL